MAVPQRRRLSLISSLLWSGVWLFPLASPLSTAKSSLAVAGLAAFAIGYTLVAAAGFESLGPRWLRLAGVAVVWALALTLASAYGPEWSLLLLYAGSSGTAVWAPAPRPTVAGMVAAVAVIVAIGQVKGFSLGTVGVTAGGTVLACGVVYAVRQMSALIAELRFTREALAAAAVEQERLRFSRDLHDLLGQTLSLVVVKAEAVRRLVGQDTATAAAQARDIEEVGRRALAEVRDAVAGYRDTGLLAEIAQARRMLTAADIALTVRMPTSTLPASVDRLLAWVVREAATNVARHSQAAQCEIEVRVDERVATVEVRDDGSGPTEVGSPGNGLRGLAERLAAAGGSLLAGPADDGGFLVTARAPLSATAS
jgi:two-component system sensor histidine kinase DesK